MHCPSSFSQIQHDLSVFPKVDLERNAHEIPQRFGQRQSLCHYTIKNNQVLYAICVELLILLWSLGGDKPIDKRRIPLSLLTFKKYSESNFPNA